VGYAKDQFAQASRIASCDLNVKTEDGRDRVLDRASSVSYDSPMTECRNCRQTLDPTDRFCRMCGTPAGATPGFWSFRRPIPSPDQAANYWRGFFRPFFMTAFIFFGAFFVVSLILVGIWFFMFHR
jgi:hypothetical protein